MYYSRSTRGFYSKEVHGDSIPVDAVEISTDLYTGLLNSQANGDIIQSDENGFPITLPPAKPSPEIIVEVPIREQITQLETAQLLPRITREFMLGSFEATFTSEQLANNYSYQKLKEFDSKIVDLRSKL